MHVRRGIVVASSIVLAMTLSACGSSSPTSAPSKTAATVSAASKHRVCMAEHGVPQGGLGSGGGAAASGASGPSGPSGMAAIRAAARAACAQLAPLGPSTTGPFQAYTACMRDHGAALGARSRAGAGASGPSGSSGSQGPGSATFVEANKACSPLLGGRLRTTSTTRG